MVQLLALILTTVVGLYSSVQFLGQGTSKKTSPIFHKLDEGQFRTLIQSRTFFAKCFSYTHPVFKSIKYSISYNDDKSFSETLYLFGKKDCQGSLSILEAKGHYSLGNDLNNDIPTWEINYKHDNALIKLFNEKTRLKLAETYRDSKCSVDPSKLYEIFNIGNEDCFGFDLRGLKSLEFNIVGLATDYQGDELYLFAGQKDETYSGEKEELRPRSLDFDNKLL